MELGPSLGFEPHNFDYFVGEEANFDDNQGDPEQPREAKGPGRS